MMKIAFIAIFFLFVKYLPFFKIFAIIIKQSYKGASYNGSTPVSKTVNVGSIPTAPAMANVVKWLTQRIVAPSCVGSNPTIRPISNYRY